MKKSALFAITLATLTNISLPNVAAADTVLGVYAGAGTWQSEFSGTVNSTFSSAIDVKEDLGLDKDSNNVFWIALEHPIPLIPNIKIRKTALDTDSSAVAIRRFEFLDSVFLAQFNVTTELDLSHTDGILYYEILDNWLSLDLGLTLRKFDGEVKLTSDGEQALITVDETTPLLYAMAQIDLPFTGLYVGAEADAISISEGNITDITLKLGYESPYRFGAELGYRVMNLALDEVNNLDSDVDIDGFYAAITLHI